MALITAAAATAAAADADLQVREFFARHYCPSRLVVAIVGDVRAEQVWLASWPGPCPVHWRGWGVGAAGRGKARERVAALWQPEPAVHPIVIGIEASLQALHKE